MVHNHSMSTAHQRKEQARRGLQRRRRRERLEQLERQWLQWLQPTTTETTGLFFADYLL